MQSQFDTEEALAAYKERCLNIVAADLTTEFTELPAAVAFWSARYAEAWEQEQLAEATYKKHWGREFIAARHSGTKAPAVDEVKAALEADEDLAALKTAAITAGKERIEAKGVMDAVISKRDMLQSLGATKRAERELRTMETSGTEDTWG